MLFEPHNRHLWIIPVEEETEKSAPPFVLPDEYKPPQTSYVICDILGMACDCETSLDIGDRIIVDRVTIQEMKAENETIYVVKENYVYGRICDEID